MNRATIMIWVKEEKNICQSLYLISGQMDMFVWNTSIPRFENKTPPALIKLLIKMKMSILVNQSYYSWSLFWLQKDKAHKDCGSLRYISQQPWYSIPLCIFLAPPMVRKLIHFGGIKSRKWRSGQCTYPIDDCHARHSEHFASCYHATLN